MPCVLGACRATPLKKITTLSEATLRLASRARNKQPYVLAAAVAGDENEELVVRTAWDGWVMVRSAAADNITARMACDTLPLPTLSGAAAHMQRLCDDACPGRFIGFV
jgi:hypothetical protein